MGPDNTGPDDMEPDNTEPDNAEPDNAEQVPLVHRSRRGSMDRPGVVLVE